MTRILNVGISILSLFALACLASHDRPFDKTYDFVVIGSGIGGTVAAGLAEAGHEVLLVEKGPYRDCPLCHDSIQSPISTIRMTEVDPRYMTLPQLMGSILYDTRLSTNGGTLSGFGALYVLPSSERIQRNYPGSISYDALRPFMKRSVDHYCHYFPESVTGISPSDCSFYHGKNGPMQINPTHFDSLSNVTKHLINGVEALGVPFLSDYNVPNRTQGIYITQFFREIQERTNPNSIRTRRQNTWNTFLKRGNVPNLDIVYNARATKILFNRKEAEGVSVLVNGVSYDVNARNEVIISGGVVESPKLLQLSGIGDAALLAKHDIPLIHNNTLVGKNVHNHMAITYCYKAKQPVSVNSSMNTGDSFVIFLKTPESTYNAPNVEIEIVDGLFVGPLRELITGLPTFTLPTLAQQATGQPIPYIGFIATLTDATPVGSITIADKNPELEPLIDFGWQLSTGAIHPYTYEFRQFEWIHSWIKNLTSQENPWGRDYIEEEAFPGDLYDVPGNTLPYLFPPYAAPFPYSVQGFTEFLYTIDHIYHMTGGCNMGTEGHGVVDEYGRVYGVKYLRVLDNSIQAESPDSNPSAISITLALRALQQMLLLWY